MICFDPSLLISLRKINSYPFNTPDVLVGSIGFRGSTGFGGKASTAPAAWSETAWYWLASSSPAARGIFVCN
jgi:hypothetical protein